MARLTLAMLIAISLCTSPVLFAQGPPPHAQQQKDKGGKEDDAPSPHVSEQAIVERLQKELGVPKEVYEMIKKETPLDDKDDGKVGSAIIMSTLITVGKVHMGEKNGKFQKEDRTKNMMTVGRDVVQRRKTLSGWGGLSEEAGFEDPGKLFAAQRAIQWGSPLAEDTKIKLGVAPTQ